MERHFESFDDLGPVPEKPGVGRWVTYAAGMTGLYVAGVIICALALFGCAEDPDRLYAQSIGFRCTNDDSATADMLCKNRPAGYRAEAVSRYCYHTLADANCFDRPDQDRKNQALGSSGY